METLYDYLNGKNLSSKADMLLEVLKYYEVEIGVDSFTSNDIRTAIKIVDDYILSLTK